MEWISTKERLPPEYDFVLVFANNQGSGEPRPISIARIDSNKKWEFCDHFPSMPCNGAYMDLEYFMETDDITHWMSLPPLPEQYGMD